MVVEEKADSAPSSTAAKLKVKEDPDRRGVVWMVVFASIFAGLALGDLGINCFTLGTGVGLAAAWSALV